ncbi:MAG: flagellar hook-associated protein FlgL [Acidobacteriaceae bacterium]
MRVNPQYLNNVVGALDQTTAVQQQLTEEISSGNAVQQLSDNPAAVGQNVLLSTAISAADQYQQTASSAQGMLQVTDSTLGSVVSQLTQALSLATEGNNGTLNASNEQAIATQLTGIRDEVLSLANTSYLGQYLFSGSVNAAPFSINTTSSPATVTYHGDAAVNSVTTPDGQAIALNVPGDQIFTAGGASALGALNQLIADYSSNNISAAQNDINQLSTALSNVSQKRVALDNSLTRLTATGGFAQTQSTQLQFTQTTLMQADLAEVATQLKNSETQQSALMQVFSALGTNSLFNVIRG